MVDAWCWSTVPHNTNECVLLWSFYGTDNHIHTKGRCTLCMKMTGFSCKLLEICSKKGPFIDTQTHNDMQQLTPKCSLIFKGLLLQSVIDIYWSSICLCVQFLLFFKSILKTFQDFLDSYCRNIIDILNHFNYGTCFLIHCLNPLMYQGELSTSISMYSCI